MFTKRCVRSLILVVCRRPTILRLFFSLFTIGALFLATASTGIAGITEIQGVTAKGAHYLFFVPDGMDGDLWNEEVVYYAHGYSPWDSEEFTAFIGSDIVQYQLDETEDIREALLDMGYAFGLSTYSGFGWAVKEGVRETHQLRSLFRSEFGKPTRSYIMGDSMGGLITVALAETYPQHYDGALPICGAVGGAMEALETIVFHPRVLLDYYFPGVLPGTAADPPVGVTTIDYFWGGIGGSIWAALAADPGKAREMAGVKQLDLLFADDSELFDTVRRRLFFYTVGAFEFIERAHGHIPFDNTDVYYTDSSDDLSLNAGVERIDSSRSAERYFRHYYEPTGRLKIPVLSLHNSRDPIVPISAEDIYEEKVKDADSEEWLSRRTIDRYGHCAFTTDEIITAFGDLVAWVDLVQEEDGGDQECEGEED